ncbi:MAG: family 43 glycosylhydrolase, partial [Myxococcota bacterium]|nr:family 43 glycosylhydrolase [Myxococcota bacterium]
APAGGSSGASSAGPGTSGGGASGSGDNGQPPWEAGTPDPGDGSTGSAESSTGPSAEAGPTSDGASAGAWPTCTDDMAVDAKPDNSNGRLYPPIAPLLNHKIRDTYIAPAYNETTPDGLYYLIGTTANKPDAWSTYDGIELWSSPDLKNWTYLGFVWTFAEARQAEPSAWYSQKVTYSSPSHNGGLPYELEVIWAPEIHYIKGNWYIVFSMPSAYEGMLKSTTGKVTGPYRNAIGGSGSIAKGHIDPDLFLDTDGAVYWIDKDGGGAKMLPDLSGLAEPLRRNISGQATPGDEGAFLFKAFGQYYFDVTVGRASTPDGKYSSWLMSSGSIWGSYAPRYEAVPDGGHNNYFRDKNCKMWSTMFGNDTKAPVYNLPAIVPVEFDSSHRVRVDFDPR